MQSSKLQEGIKDQISNTKRSQRIAKREHGTMLLTAFSDVSKARNVINLTIS